MIRKMHLRTIAAICPCDPGVFEAFVDVYTCVEFDYKHAINQVNSKVADRVPVGRWLLKASRKDLLRKSQRVLFRVALVREGRKSAQADVKNHAG